MQKNPFLLQRLATEWFIFNSDLSKGRLNYIIYTDSHMQTYFNDKWCHIKKAELFCKEL